MTEMLGATTPTGSGTRVLIVEDDPAQARLLSRSFARQRPDLTIITSGNGDEAVRLLSDSGADLILTELTMPGLDGFEFLAWAAHHCPEVPVFAMSTLGDDETIARVNALGAVGYFAKPIDVKAVVLRLTAELSQTVRGHVQNVSLASFLQLMEMERKTCTLTVTCPGNTGTLVIRKGELIDADTGELRGERAAIAIVAWHNPSITIARHVTTEFRSIEQPLSFIIMEAMRVQDEAARASGQSEWPASGRGLRGSSLPLAKSVAARSRTGALELPSGLRAIAVAETSTGALLHWAASEDFAMPEHATVASRLLAQQSEAFRLSDPSQSIDEIVLFSATRGEIIRPLSALDGRFGMVVFELSECNLVVARLELTRFVFACG
jgi:DNA-binding response OmpR family regulator